MSKTMTKERRKKIYDMTRGKCFYCGYDIDLENFHVDHFIPKAKGGKMKENLVPACPQCNMIKGDKSIEEFRRVILNYLHTDTHVMMVDKYMTIVRKPIKFYFEKRKFLKK